MLKGEVFGRQLFENQIFALFINTFLNGNNGVCGDYLNGMAVTYSGNNVTIDSGAVCIQGRFLEEDTSTTLDAGNSNLFCKLVIEIDLDKINTEDSFNQGYYKVVTDSTGYPELTQTNIVGTNSGIYQYELARFKTSANGISDFQDMRTYLDIPTIYDTVRQMVQDAIDSIEDGSAFALKEDFERKGTIETLATLNSGTSSTVTVSDLSQYALIILQCNYHSDINRVMGSVMGTYEQFKASNIAWNCSSGDITNYLVTAKYNSDTSVTLTRKGTYDAVTLLGIKK